MFAPHLQLVRRLGEGGMGQLWLPEQTSPVRRLVGLKLTKAVMYDESVLQRFQTERQSLALMDHPAIAKVFDAGTTLHGQPYFVMEYVPGLPITESTPHTDQFKLHVSELILLDAQLFGLLAAEFALCDSFGNSSEIRREFLRNAKQY
jgi:eukaryotic-like serine/threonine-protein kinase